MTAPTGPIIYTSQPPEAMTYEEYLLAVAAVTAALAQVVAAISIPLQAAQLTRADWLSFLTATYPYVVNARQEVSKLARQYYDSERAKHVPPIRIPMFSEEIIGPDGNPIRIEDNSGQLRLVYPRLKINLPSYEPEWYEEAMNAVVDDLIKAGTTDAAIARVVSAPLKEAENAGRRTMMWAVEDDAQVMGWARVEGGESSCGFCAMLISRGPVYKSADTSGLKAKSNTLAVEIWRQAQATGDDSMLDELMNRWHKNCDCKVVPVFDRFNWPGRDQYMYYEDLWRKNAKGKTVEDRFNNFRQAVEGGRRDNLIEFPTAA